MARRLPVSRRRAIADRPYWLVGLGTRLGLCSAALFAVAAFLAHLITERLQREQRQQGEVAAAWAERLMRGSEPTPYGWLPDIESSQLVDTELLAAGAAFAMLDPRDRTVQISERLRPTELAELRAGEDAELPEFGPVTVTRVPLTMFGQVHGSFVLLSRPGTTVPPPPGTHVPELRGPPMDWVFLVIGAAMTGAGVFAMTQILAVGRLRRMTRIAYGSTARSANPRRFSDLGADEIGALSAALGSMQQRAHRLLTIMGDRENKRRDWLAQLSHDLRTPLAALQLRLDQARRGATGTQLEAIATAVRDCERIQALASGFMDLAELEVTENFAVEEIMPEELVGQAVRGLTPIAEKAGVELTTRIEPQPTVWGDGRLLLRGLENLVRNAIRHAARNVEVGIEAREGLMRFFVRDDGAGFEGLQPGVETDFEAWRGRRVGGLGLRVADRVAHAHGGRLLLENSATGTIATCVIDMMHEPEPHWRSDLDADLEDFDART